MSKKLPLTDFRAVRSKLEPHEFAISEGQDVPPSDLVDSDIWDGIMHLCIYQKTFRSGFPITMASVFG
jgi:hypothetical protein